MILGDFLKAAAQLSDPRFRRVLWRGLGLTLALLVAITAAVLVLLGRVLPETLALPLVGPVTWLGEAASLATLAAMLGLSVFVMVPVAAAFTGFFLDDVAAAVEARHYPGLAPARAVGLVEALRDSAAFFGVIVAVNALAIVLYFIVGPFAPVLFWAVNGYLLGREYFQMAAMRRVGRQAALRLRRRYGLRIWAAGVLMAVPLSVPVLNLLVPVLGAATFTHQFHRLAGSSAG